MDDDADRESPERGDSRSPRVRTSELATIELPNGRTIGVRVSDVSASGFRMETPELLEVGQKVKLLTRRYDPVPVEIRWSEERQAGAVFLSAPENGVS